MRHVIALLFLLLPATVAAQGAATLIADSVTVPAGGQQLIAAGNVEVFYDGTRLSAQRITFDQVTDRLTIEGPIYILGPDNVILTADAASLDPKLENGILRGARLVLNQQLQLAAHQIDRVDGRFTQLYQVAATSCHICETGETPLWEIRARRVIHDQDARQLYFDNAHFRLAGMPILYVPRMRLPDPTLTRATGLLVPSLAISDTLGTVLKLPYFIRLGDHRDLTLTPYVATSTATLEAAYRQAYLRGDLTIDAAVTRDDLTDNTRSYLFADGIFQLDDDVVLRFDVEYTSDNAYLTEYGFSDKDRLDSEVSLERVRDRDLTQLSLTYFSSLRDSDISTTLPPLLAEASWERRLSYHGGTLSLTSDMQSHYREKSTDIEGRDVARLGFGAAWGVARHWPVGFLVSGSLGVDLDYYNVSDDSTVDDTIRSTIFAETTLRYPLIRQTERATHILEPVVQLAWSDVRGGKVINEDSTATEFDQGNLFALSRFAGEDAVEQGVRGAVGLTWSRTAQGGWDSMLTLGRVFRASPNTRFSETSGLGATASDWLLAGHLRVPAGIALDGRIVFDDRFEVSKAEARAGWSGDRFDLDASYIYLPADVTETRTSEVSEFTIDSTYRFNDVWSVGFDTRYDARESAPTRAGLSVGWQNECVTVDFSVSRRFTSSTTLSPSTDFGFEIGLNGFSAGRSAITPSHECAT